MRKILIILIVFSVLFLCSCSVQKKMNAEIFLERMSDALPKENINLKFNENNKTVLLLNNGYIMEIFQNEYGDVIRISLSCADVKDIESFVTFSGKITNIYSPDDDFDIIKKNIFNTENKPLYFKSQWHEYCGYKNENGIYFSVNNNYLNPKETPDLTLKSNDKVDF